MARRAKGHARIPFSSRSLSLKWEKRQDMINTAWSQVQHCLACSVYPLIPVCFVLQLPTLTPRLQPPHQPPQAANFFLWPLLVGIGYFPQVPLSDSGHTTRKLPDVSLRINPNGFPCSHFLSLAPLNLSLPFLKPSGKWQMISLHLRDEFPSARYQGSRI